MRKNKKKKPSGASNAVDGKRARPLYWIGMVCLAGIWMFILGVLVGRGTAPISVDIKKLQRELAEITHGIQAREEEKLNSYAEQITEKPDYDFYKSLKEADTETAGIAKDDSESAASGLLKKKSLSKITKRQMLYKKRQATPLPVSQTETAAGLTYRWTIQVMAQGDATAADKVVADLIHQGYPGYKVMAKTVGNTIFYQVRVGPFKDKTEADRNLSRLKQKNYNAVLIPM